MKSKGRKVNESFGSMIRYLREKQGYSLKDLEDITGISPSYINRIERGTRACPSYPIIEKLAKALNADISELLEISELSMTDVNVNIRMIKKWKIIMYKKWPKAFQIPSSNYYLSTEF